MQETVITIVSAESDGLGDALASKIMAEIRSFGVDDVNYKWLERGKALDIFINIYNAELTEKLRAHFKGQGGFDVFIQQNDDTRKKRLLIADMDATIVVGETLDELADHVGLKEKVSAITERAMRGELDFEAALRERVGMLTGLPLTQVFEVVQSMQLSKGARTLVQTMKRHGARCVLVSGGFDFFTGQAASLCGFDAHFGNRLGLADEKLTGDVLSPIVDKSFKEKKLKEESANLNLPSAMTMAVGDGANDIPMLTAAGAGVGYFAKPAVLVATPFQVRYTDLTALLYMQGFSDKEIAR